MILNKKGLVILPLAALLFSCGGAKNISYEEAVEFVNTNYTSTEKKPVTKMSGEFNGTASDETSKAYVRNIAITYGFTELDDNLHFSGDLPIEGVTADPLTSDQLVKPGIGVEVAYILNGKSLIAAESILHCTPEVEEEQYPYYEQITASLTTNDQGYITYQTMKVTQKGWISDSNDSPIQIDCSYEWSTTSVY